MERVLVTGGTGGLGRKVVALLLQGEFMVRVMSRHGRTEQLPVEVEWVQADLTRENTLPEAVRDVRTIIHAATDPTITVSGVDPRRMIASSDAVDVGGTERLLRAAASADVAHFIYISIVGVERLSIPYYRNKVRAEALVQESAVPWSILRATQFYSLIDTVFQQLSRLPFWMPVPANIPLQPIETGEVAHHLLEVVEDGPLGRLPDIGGPEVAPIESLAGTWLAICGLNRKLLPVPIPGESGRALRDGALVSPANRYGKLTWEQWLKKMDDSGWRPSLP